MSAKSSAAGSLPLARAVAQYMSRIRQRRAPATYETYRQAIKLFLVLLHEELGVDPWSVPVSALEPAWIEHYLEHLQRHKSIETEHVYSRAVMGFYKEAVNRGWAALNAGALQDSVRHLRRRKGRRLPRFPQEEIEAILDYAQKFPLPPREDGDAYRERLRILRDAAFILTLADTGLRVSEACALTRGDVDLAEGQARVIGKGNQEAIVRISNRVIRALRRYLKERAPLDGAQSTTALAELALFAQHSKRAGQRIEPISRWTGGDVVARWANLALSEEVHANLQAQDMPITPHTFRHYFVTTVLRGTGNLRLAQRFARHASPTTTTRYLHLSDEELDVAYHELFNE
jgi:integrase